MLRDLKILSSPVEYCAFMVAIMMTRYNVDDSIRVQSSVESIVSKLNSLLYGDKADFQVTRAALHQGIYLFKKVLQSLGYEVVEMHGKEIQLQDFFDLPGGKRGYEIKFPNVAKSSPPLGYTRNSLNTAILVNRNCILLRSNYQQSAFDSCSPVFIELFVDITNVMKAHEKADESFESPEASLTKSSFKARKRIDELSDRSIKNNGKRILDYTEGTYGVEDAELYITAAYDIVVKKNRKNSTPELRSLSYLEEIEIAVNYDEEIFETDMRVVNALGKIKKKNVVMSSEQKCQILTVFDAVKLVLSDIDITDINPESAAATFKLLRSYNGICNMSVRSILRLNECRDIVLKRRGMSIQTNFEAEVWGNLMLCYFETNNDMVMNQ
jgi:hypothetical protein